MLLRHARLRLSVQGLSARLTCTAATAHSQCQRLPAVCSAHHRLSARALATTTTAAPKSAPPAAAAAPASSSSPAASPSSHFQLTSYSSLPHPARSHTCASAVAAFLSADAGADSQPPVVSLCGWLQSSRPVSSSLCFGLLRDHTGTLQVSWQRHSDAPDAPSDHLPADAAAQLARLPLESVIRVSGTLRARPPGQSNPMQGEAGSMELVISSLHVLNVPAGILPLSLESDPTLPPAGFPPSPLSAATNDELRMTHRYLELRRPWVQRLLSLRSSVSHAVRDFLTESAGFTEVETPSLFKSTPEGAAEFLVPTRTRGKFYALPQSPQQHKQLLMVGGVPRYFQIARCFRDEGSRADRQPEFTQIDLEMSFVTQEEIMHTVEGMFRHITEKSMFSRSVRSPDAPSIPAPAAPTYPLQRRSFAEVMSTYGVDKPDTRFDLPLVDLSAMVRKALQSAPGSSIRCPPFEEALAAPEGSVLAIRVPDVAKGMSRKDLETLQKELGKSVLFVRVKDGEMKTPALFQSLFSSVPFRSALQERMAGLCDSDILLVAASPQPMGANAVLGRARIQAAHALVERGILQMSARQLNPFWVVDFPLFDCTLPTVTPSSAEGAASTEVTLESISLCAMHHPFTAPVPEDADRLTALLAELEAARAARGADFSMRHVPLTPQQLLTLRSIRGQHYDLVCNGVELGGGSIRLHSAPLQRQVLQLLGADVSTFTHLLSALGSGAPPHGGLALGMDRVVGLVGAAEQERWNEEWRARRETLAPTAGGKKVVVEPIRSYGLSLPIRDVIAFPKTTTGNDLMAQAPSEVPAELLQQYHIQIAPEPVKSQ